MRPDAPVSSVMSMSLFTASPDALAGEVEARARQRGICHVLVLDGQKLVGVTCTCDLHESGPDAVVSSCMSWPVVTVDANASLSSAAALMTARHVGCLPVRAGRSVVGIVTRGDLTRAGVRLDDEGQHLCALCHGRHHVRPEPHNPEVGVCLDCRDQDQPVQPAGSLAQGSLQRN